MDRILNADTKRSLLILLGLSACLAYLFWPGIAHSEVPAFRDAYHFYYPQAVWLREQANLGNWFPQWNHLAGLGVSVPGQVSSAIYYPLRILWFLPGCTVEQCYSLFIYFHLLMAALGMRLAALRLSLSTAAADFAGVSYALSCPVFFQHNNLIYLTSATWIGFALAALIEGCRPKTAHPIQPRGRWSSPMIVGVFTTASSFMLLGGDPHTLANCWILATLALPLSLWYYRRLSDTKRWGQLLATSVLATLLITSIQWIPAWRWAQHSERTNQTLAAESNLQKVLEGLAPDHRAVLEFVEPARATHSDLPYDFSIAPWYLSTLAWPQLGGHYLPENSRVFSALPAEGRMWIPSLSFGVVPLLCLGLLFTRGHIKRSLRIRKLQVLAGLTLFALLASFGNYSVGWLLRELLKALQLDNWAASLPPDHYSSLYGLLTNIPGYDAFRFPGKWSVWFAAGASLLAASLTHHFAKAPSKMRSTDSGLEPQRQPQSITIPKPLAGGLLLATMILFGLSYFFTSLDLRFPNDGWLGQATSAAVLSNTRWALAASFIIGIAALGFRLLPMKAIVPLTLAEMTWSAAAWVSFVPAPDAVTLRDDLPENARVWSSPLSGRFQYDAVTDKSLPEAQSRYQDQFLLAKLNEIPGVSNLGSIVSVDPLLTARLRFWLNTQDRLAEDQPAVERTLAALGITHRLVRKHNSDAGPVAGVVRWHAIPEARPFCEWVVNGLPVPVEQAGPDWNWTSAGELKIVGAAPADNAILLIRQLNDGQWTAAGEEHGEDSAEVAISDNYAGVLTPFIELEVPLQIRQITLRRQSW